MGIVPLFSWIQMSGLAGLAAVSCTCPSALRRERKTRMPESVGKTGPGNEAQLTLAGGSGSEPWSNSGFNVSIHAAIRYMKWKLLTGYPGCDHWFPRPGQGTGSERGGPRRASLKPVMLFDVESDPEERQEVSDQHRDMVDHLLRRLRHYQNTAEPIIFPDDDPRCDPGTGAWGPWA